MSSNLHSLWESAGGNVPDHWEFKTIEELLENSKSISVGVMYPGQNTEDGVPLIRVSDVKNGAIASKPEFCISLKIDEEYKRTRLNGTELLITLVGTPGDCVIVTEEMAGWNAARALAVVRLADIEIRSWLRYVLLSKPARHLIDVRLNTTVQKTLNLKDIRELGIPIPPKHEREEIVKVIDSIESKSLINRQTNQTLEQIAQALFKSWFVDFDPVKAKIAAKQAGGTAEQIERAAMAAISGAVQGCTNVAGAGSAGATKTETELDQLEAQGRANAASTGCAEAASQYQNLKTTAALFPDELVDSELGEIPKGWDIKLLSEISENHSTTFDFSKVDEVVFVNTGDVSNGRFLHKNYTNKIGLPGQAKKSIKKNDILYSEIRPKNKRFAYVAEACDDYVVSTKFMVIRSLGFVHPRYLYQILRQEKTIREFNLIAESRSGTFPQITFDSIGYMPIVVPGKEIQEIFMEFFTPIIEKIDLVVKEEKNLIELRNSLLPKLLSGQLLIS
ncbi:MAG: restriction endonuclease subunit S [Pseudomonadota bacterium]|nr:restriction endonuclease subunit S [Pseudomonadota bacterium]